MSDYSNFTISPVDEILESETVAGIRVWHALSIICSILLLLLILVCCCVSFRIPRTKQEIEADYIRKQIARKFRKQLNLIPDCEMDEMDLSKAVEKVRFELMSDEEKIIFLKTADYEVENGDKETAIKFKSESPENISIDSSTAKLRTSEEKLTSKGATSKIFSNKLVTIVNAFNVLRPKRALVEGCSSKQLTV